MTKTRKTMLDRIEVGYGHWTAAREPQWWPLMPGPLHEDNEHFNLDALHRHVHPVYLSDTHYARAEGNGKAPNRVWITPLSQWADPRTHEELPRLNTDKSGTLIGKNDRETLTIVLTLCIRTVRRKRRRAMPEHPFSRTNGPYKRPSGFSSVIAAYCAHGEPARAPGGICPHRGANLKSLTPDADGTVVCPQHGLRCRLT